MKKAIQRWSDLRSWLASFRSKCSLEYTIQSSRQRFELSRDGRATCPPDHASDGDYKKSCIKCHQIYDERLLKCPRCGSKMCYYVWFISDDVPLNDAAEELPFGFTISLLPGGVW